MSTSPFTIKESLSFGWATFKKDPWFYVGVTLALSAFTIIVDSLTGDGYGFMGVIGFLISLLASTVVTIAYARLALSASQGTHVGWDGLWAPQYFFSVLGAVILQTLIILIGLVLLIVPGVIAALLLSFTQLAVVDKNLSPVDALKESYRLARPHLAKLFLLMLALIGINLLGLLALVVGLLVTIPVSLITVAHIYRTLSGAQELVVVEHVPPTPQ